MDVMNSVQEVICATEQVGQPKLCMYYLRAGSTPHNSFWTLHHGVQCQKKIFMSGENAASYFCDCDLLPKSSLSGAVFITTYHSLITIHNNSTTHTQLWAVSFIDTNSGGLGDLIWSFLPSQFAGRGSVCDATMAGDTRRSVPRSATGSPKEQEQPVREGEYIEYVRNAFWSIYDEPVWFFTRHEAKRADPTLCLGRQWCHFRLCRGLVRRRPVF